MLGGILESESYGESGSVDIDINVMTTPTCSLITPSQVKILSYVGKEGGEGVNMFRKVRTTLRTFLPARTHKVIPARGVDWSD